MKSPKAALERLLMLSPQSDESVNEYYERIAAEFYKDTGWMAPGKDEPAAAGSSPSIEVKEKRMSQWKTKIREDAKEAIPIAELEGQAVELLKAYPHKGGPQGHDLRMEWWDNMDALLTQLKALK